MQYKAWLPGRRCSGNKVYKYNGARPGLCYTFYGYAEELDQNFDGFLLLPKSKTPKLSVTCPIKFVLKRYFCCGQEVRTSWTRPDVRVPAKNIFSRSRLNCHLRPLRMISGRKTLQIIQDLHGKAWKCQLSHIGIYIASDGRKTCYFFPCQTAACFYLPEKWHFVLYEKIR